MRAITLIILIASYYSNTAQTKLYSEKILFNYKSAALTSENLKQIRTSWERLPSNSSVELLLVSDKEVRKLDPLAIVTLTKARADAIKLFLTSQKIVNQNDIELNTRAYFENEIIHGTNASFKSVVKDPYKVYSLVLSKEVPMCFDYTAAELRTLSSKEPAKFTINTNQDAMITGPGGIIVLIPANSFLLPDQKKSADINIKLWEFLTTEDMIMADLYTSNTGRLLETGGMIYINADYEGQCLKLLRSSKIIIKFPTYQKLDSMRLFKGVPLPEIIDWKKTDNMDKIDPAIITDGEPAYEGDGEGGLSYYILESSGLGWINCDRFSEVEEKMDLVFTVPENLNGTAGLIFTEINSIMPGDLLKTKKNNVLFNNIPKGKEVVLLVYAISKDKKNVYYAKSKLISGDALKEEMKFSETTMAEFKEVLKGIKY